MVDQCDSDISTVIPNIYLVVFATSSNTKEKIIHKTHHHSFIKVNIPMKNMIKCAFGIAVGISESR
jgi:hypothetical protein